MFGVREEFFCTAETFPSVKSLVEEICCGSFEDPDTFTNEFNVTFNFNCDGQEIWTARGYMVIY